MNASQTYDLLCIGNYTKDTIITPAGVRHTDGGAVNYAAHAAARLGLSTAVVTHLAEEDSRVIDRFKQANIDCFVTFTPHSTHMRLEYPTDNPDIRKLSVAYTAGPITADEVADLKAKAAVIGTSLRGEVGIDVLKALSEKNVMLGADIQGFVRVLEGRELIHAPWDEMEETLAYVAIVKSDAVEAEFLTGEADVYKAAHRLCQWGPREVVLTHKDGLLIYADGGYKELCFFPAAVNGRSGRGDTCLGAYVAMRLSKPPAEAGVWAAAVTSLKMEGLGPFDRSIHEVQDLIRRRYSRA